MARKAQNLTITEVTTTTTEWRVKVIILEKTNIYTAKDGRRTQKILMQDSQSNRIEGILWDQTITLLQKSLSPFSTYIIGEAKVQPIKELYRHMSPGMTLEWVFMASTYIRPITNPEEFIVYPEIETTSFHTIPSLIGTRNPIDIMAAVIHMKAPRELVARGKLTPLQEFTVVDQSMKPYSLTMWAEFVTNQASTIFHKRETMPIIICRRLIATEYSGGSLSTVPFSYVTVEPDIPQVKHMQKWAKENADRIKALAITEGTKTTQMTSQPQKGNTAQQTQFTTADSQDIDMIGNMSIQDTSQLIYYSTCPKCHQPTKAQGNEEFHCNTCNEDEIAMPRCKIVVELRDDTRIIAATMFDKNTEKLLEHTATQLHGMEPKEIEGLMHMANQKLLGQQVKAQIRISGKKYADQRPRYNIQNWTASDITGDVRSTEKQCIKNMEDTPEKQEVKRSRETTGETSQEGTDKSNKENPKETNSPTLKKVKLEYPTKP